MYTDTPSGRFIWAFCGESKKYFKTFYSWKELETLAKYR